MDKKILVISVFFAVLYSCHTINNPAGKLTSINNEFTAGNFKRVFFLADSIKML